MTEAPKKKSGGRVKISAQDEDPTVWFGRKQKINGRSQIYVNEATDETDVLSLAIHSGISSDEELSTFMLLETTLGTLAAAAKSAMAHSSKISANPDGSIVTRYYTPTTPPPGMPDPRISYRPSPEDKPARWAVKGFLISIICSLLDDSQRLKIIARASSAGPEAAEGILNACPMMVTFRGQRRDLSSIPMSEIELAENEVMTTQGVLTRDVVSIRKMLHSNCERMLMLMSTKMRDIEGNAHAEQMLRVAQVAELEGTLDREIAARSHEISAFRAERAITQQQFRALMVFRDAESHARQHIISVFHEGIASMMWKVSQFRRFIIPPAVVESTPIIEASEVATVRQQLEDMKLEVARLKEDARSSVVPKPKTRRKTRDPDLHLATETEIKLAVKSRSTGNLSTPMSSPASTFSRRRAGSASILEEEKELDVARKLRSLSRSREQDICDVEAASEQLTDVIESLSSMMTKVELTIEDVATRRTMILNRMRSLSMHSRSIASIIRERPYLLNLARRMNHERRPIVQLPPLRAIINVAAGNLKALQHIETITLESMGGLFEVMSLAEAAASAESTPHEEVVIPAVRLEECKMSPPKLLTRATLRRHDVSRHSESE